MKFKSSQMAGMNRCNKRRQHNILEGTETSRIYDEVSIQKDTILKAVGRGVRKEDVVRHIYSKYEELDFPNSKTMELKAAQAAKQVWRYIKSETRRPYRAKSMDLNIFGIEVLGIKPDLMFIDTKTRVIELVKIKCGLPNVTQNGNKEDKSVEKCLELFNFIKYGEAIIPEGEEWTIKASYYFLRKTNPYDNEKKGEFAEDFFGPGGNIVTLEEVITTPINRDNCIFGKEDRYCQCNDGTVDIYQCPYMALCANGFENLTPLEIIFKPQFEEFAKGKEECEQEDCKYCDFNQICHFNFAPKSIEVEEKVKPLSEINPSDEQEKVLNYREGVARVNAGAGAGKTFVMTYRMASIIDEEGEPDKCLMITFTNAAANEMKKRVVSYCDDLCVDADPNLLTCTTFNAFGNQIIMDNYDKLGFETQPSLIPDVTRTHIIADLINRPSNVKILADGLDYKNYDMNTKERKGALAMVKRIFDIIKQNDFSMGDEKSIKMKLSWAEQLQISVSTIETLMPIYAEYDMILREKNYIEYADQQFMLFELLRQEPNLLSDMGYKHMVIDEFQDTSEGQITLIKELMDHSEFKSLMVCGDDSQAIYGFRDTTPDFIINFEDYIGRKVDDFYLLNNFRSTPEIIQLANTIGEMNEVRVVKDLISKRETGKRPVVRGFWTKQEEREYTVEKIKEKIADGVSPEDIAYIAFDGTELEAMASLLKENNIPAILLNPEKLLNNSRVVAAIEFGKFYKQSRAVSSARIFLNALYENTILEKEDEEIDGLVAELKEVADSMRHLPNVEKKAKLLDLFLSVDDEDEVYLSFIESLSNYVTVEQILDYLEDLSLYGDRESIRRQKKYPGVVLTTAHSSKGLEWPIIFNSISKYDSKDVRAGKKARIEEQRRLFYVSITRARDELYVTGEYVAFGGKKDPTYNQYLMDAYKAMDQEFAPGEQIQKEEKKKETKKTAKKSADSLSKKLKKKALKKEA